MTTVLADKKQLTLARYEKQYADYMPEDLLKTNLAKIQAAEQTYSASVKIASFLVAQTIMVTVTDSAGKEHSVEASCGGVATVGVGVSFGDIYTADFDNLMKNTTAIGFFSAAAYLHIDFYDENSHVIGHFEGGGVSNVIGGGGGGARW
jgi:hypothetical protein